MKRQRSNAPHILDSSRLPPNNPAAVRQQRRTILLDHQDAGYIYSTSVIAKICVHCRVHTDCPSLDPYSKLQGHDGCVNAIAYSPEGRFLASAGDDSEVLIWDLFSDLSTPEARRIPSAKFGGHRVRLVLFLQLNEGRSDSIDLPFSLGEHLRSCL